MMILQPGCKRRRSLDTLEGRVSTAENEGDASNVIRKILEETPMICLLRVGLIPGLSVDPEDAASRPLKLFQPFKSPIQGHQPASRQRPEGDQIEVSDEEDEEDREKRRLILWREKPKMESSQESDKTLNPEDEVSEVSAHVSAGRVIEVDRMLTKPLSSTP
eukprot:GHVN01052752.1.p1 GENE.GHVN01052752.1~~GHVN01052752.1.p1  ORF type:complete len:162 (+),score=31.96 GHVN01052752.1:79-564(+)